ncbi:hypothetical protein [Streptomyces sp. 900105245]
MTITSQTTAFRVELDKRPAGYLVIADDAGRQVLYVERRAVHPEERRAQWNELEGACLDAEGALFLRAYTAVSHGHAATLARRAYAVADAAARMSEAIDAHLQGGRSGWLAIRVADGGSDGVLHDGYEAARAAQHYPERCTYFPVSPLTPWTLRMCEELLDFESHRLHRGLVHGAPICR